MKKRFAVFILLFVLLLSAVSCKKKQEPTDISGEEQDAEAASEETAEVSEEETNLTDAEQEAPAPSPMQSEESFTFELEKGSEGVLAPE